MGFLRSFSLSVGMVLVLLSGLFLLTEKIVLYPHERSLPLLKLNTAETAGFKTLRRIPGLHPREVISPPDWASVSVGAVGLLICLLSAAAPTKPPRR
jgi:hypothetical protein